MGPLGKAEPFRPPAAEAAKPRIKTLDPHGGDIVRR